MQEENEKDKILLPHHEQQSLCTTRLPYRQGRKLTAVKVYSVTKESNHLLIFGVPSLNLRQEIKAQFMKFGKLLQFHISLEHAAEKFTETYHAQYDRIQSARLSKRFLDTKNFYGGSLHVCYAPELETVDETRRKLIQRQRDVIFRLKNLQKDENTDTIPVNQQYNEPTMSEHKKLDMGRINIISMGKEVKEVRRKRKLNDKKYGPCFVDNKKGGVETNDKEDNITRSKSRDKNSTISNAAINYINLEENNRNMTLDNNVEIVDCTAIDNEIVTNINDLNYNNFGSEIIKKIAEKPVNRIQFHINKKS